MYSVLLSFADAIRTFFNQLTDALGFGGFLGIFLAVEALFIIIFGIRATLSYEARLKRSLDKANEWLFKHKVIDTKNIKAFNEVIKRGPKRLSYFWQQYILYREGAPSSYMTIDNLIEKPIKTSSWLSSVKNLGICTVIWTVFALMFGLASEAGETWSHVSLVVSLVIPCLVLLVGAIAIMIIKAVRVVNLDDLYHMYHLFARFVDNACAELPPYIDFDLLFTAKEIEHGNPQLREYYEARARKAKEEFESAKKNDVKYAEYNFQNVGVDGALLLDRAMKESEIYINKKTATLSQIAQAESQKEALRRNYENVQMDLQRKIQASKENIQKLIEQQASTTSRIEVGLLRQQQEKESKKQESLQRDYDQEETRYKSAKAELDKEVEKLSKVLVECLDEAEKGMSSEYQSFYEKVMKSAYAVAEKKADEEKKELKKHAEKSEQELVNVQTQIKHLMDENLSLREQLEQLKPEYKEEVVDSPEGHYDEEGNFIYADGSYHSVDGLFHDVDGRIYDMNGVEVTAEVAEEGATEESLINAQVEQFGSYIPTETENEVKIQTNEESAVETEMIESEGQQIENQEAEAQKEENIVQTEELIDQLEYPVEEEIQPTTEILAEENDVEEENISAEEVKEEVTAPARKRGRPRKRTVSAEKLQEESAPARKRGRPRKVVSEQAKEEQPKKSRGRPRKVVAENVENNAPARKRGRPRKTETTKNTNAPQQPARRRGRPRKTTNKTENVEKSATGAKRGRPKGSTKAKEPVVSQAPKKRGRPRKNPILNEDIDSISKINQLIQEEEEKLSKMKAFLNSEIDEVMKDDAKQNIDKEREKFINEVESLKAQAAAENKSDKELAIINQRLEDLIREILILNNKQ